MARKPKEPFTFESNIDAISEKIHEAPHLVMGKIGGALVKEIKQTTMKSVFGRRYNMLAGLGTGKGKKNKSGIQWAYGWDDKAGKKDKTSLQIGWKVAIPGLLGKIITGAERDPIKPVVVKNADLIQTMIAEAINEIGKK